MARPIDRIKGMTTQITSLALEIDQTRAEISMLEHIDDDAQRDAAASQSYVDRADARMTGADVSRMKRHAASLEKNRASLVEKRDRMVDKLASQ